MRDRNPGSPVPYYIDHTAQGEAHGWWTGRGAAILNMSGVVTQRQMQNLIGEGRHPETGSKLGRSWQIHPPMTDPVRLAAVQKALAKLPEDATVEQRDKVWHDIMTRPEPHAVAGLDVTVSLVKSASLLYAFGDDKVKADVMAAHHAGVRAMLVHLERHGAFTRVGAGGLRQIETAGLAAMVFDHRMSRERDPQIHAHVVVSAKVRTVGRDGAEQWLALDGKAFYQATTAARIAYERAVEHSLARSRGVRFAARAGSDIREIVGIGADNLRQYSKRRAAVVQEMDTRAKGPGRTKVDLVKGVWRRRAQDATLRTRGPQHGGESTRDAVRRWHDEDRRAGLDTAGQVRNIISRTVPDERGLLAARVLARAVRTVGDPSQITEAHLSAAADALGVRPRQRAEVVTAAVRLDPRLAAVRAVHNLSRQRAVFGREHLELAIGQVLDIDTGGDAAHDWTRVQNLADRVVADGLGGLRILNPPALVEFKPSLQRELDGQSEYTRHRDLSMTSRAVLAAEHHVLAYAARRGATAAPAALLERIATQLDLSEEKRQALRAAVGDDRRVTAIIGPAGTGKTYLQQAVAAAAQQAGVPVLGLTVGQNAANILTAATAQHDGTRLRTENVAMWLHAQHKPPAGTSVRDWTFAPGQWVIIDEASQISTHDLARLVTLLQRVAGKLIMVGDPEQVSAVGPGGMLRHLAGLGAAVHLREVHRFTNGWEGPASLRLRVGDLTVLSDYDRRGRITGGHREQLITQMIDGWAGDVAAGLRTIMLAGTEAEAATIAAQARERLIRTGQVSTTGQILLADDNHAGAGDIIVSRRNDRRLVAGDGNWVANRDQWHVDAIDERRLHVTNLRTGHQARLPVDYADKYVQLAYAGTVDSAQGHTVQTARSLVDALTSLPRLYVMLTRGELLNQAYVVTDDEPREGTPPQPEVARIEVLADIIRRATPERTATETEQQLQADVDALHIWGPIYDDLSARAQTGHYLSIVADIAGPSIADRLSGDLALPTLITRLKSLEAAGYDPRQVLNKVISPRQLDSADDIAAVLVWRVERIIGVATADPRAATAPGNAASFTARLPDLDTAGDIGEGLRDVAQRCDQRVTGLTQQAALQQPAWAHGLGDIPDTGPGRAQWQAAARLVVTYRDRYQITGDEPIGPEPQPQQLDQWGSWHRARIALGTATMTGQLAAADDPQLQQLVTAQRRADTDAPAYVGDHLRDAHLDLAAAEQHVRDLHLLIADVDNAGRHAARHVETRAPRWWQRGPSRTRATAQQAEAQQRLDDATTRIGALREDLTTATDDVDEHRGTVAQLESLHSDWTRWYTDALPTRYAGLAANAEQTRRMSARVAGLSEAVAATTAKVRAIDDLRPRPRIEAMPDDLSDQAEAAYERTTDPDPNPDDGILTVDD